MTVYEIIERSVQMHPTLFQEELERQGCDHRIYASQYRHLPNAAAKSASSMAEACDRAIANIGEGDVHAIVTDFSQMIIALNVAGRLQCLPRHVMDGAVAAISAVYDRSE